MDFAEQEAALIHTLNTKELMDEPLTRVSDLLEYFDEIEAQAGISAPMNLKCSLIDTIDVPKEQNKKNQHFPNKAMISIRDIKETFSGKRNQKSIVGLMELIKAHS